MTHDTRDRAHVLCPICAAAGLDGEAVAWVAQDQSERRGRYWVLDGFECERGHTWSDLRAYEAQVLDDAIEWLDQRDAALRDAHWDTRYDARFDQ